MKGGIQSRQWRKNSLINTQEQWDRGKNPGDQQDRAEGAEDLDYRASQKEGEERRENLHVVSAVCSEAARFVGCE